MGGGNQRRGSADRLVLYCSTFSAPLSRPPAAGPLCPPAGHSTEDPRPNGQRTRLGRNRPLSPNTKTSRDRTRTAIGRCRSLKGNSSMAQGSPHSGYPGLGTFIIGLNPEGVRFRADRGNRPHQSVFAQETTGRIPPAFPPVGTPEASPFRAESIWLPRNPGSCSVTSKTVGRGAVGGISSSRPLSNRNWDWPSGIQPGPEQV